MRDLKIAYGNSRQAKFWANKTIKFDELCDRLRNPVRTSETAEEYPKLPKKQRDDIKVLLAKNILLKRVIVKTDLICGVGYCIV